MENSINPAQIVLDRILADVEIARNTPELTDAFTYSKYKDLPEEEQRRNQKIANLQYELKKNSLIPGELTIYDLINEFYQYDLSVILDARLNNDATDENREEWNALLELINALPKELPKELITPLFDLSLLEKIDIWNDDEPYIYGSDSTMDELQSAIDRIYHLIKLCQDPIKSSYLSFFKDPYYYFAKCVMSHELGLEEDNYAYLYISGTAMEITVLHYIAQKEYVSPIDRALILLIDNKI